MRSGRRILKPSCSGNRVRHFAGTYRRRCFLTDFLPEEGMLANFRLENLTVWIMNNPVTAGNRAIMIGIALGTASVSLKILLGVDRSYLGGGD